jgi:hypothetical protein
VLPITTTERCAVVAARTKAKSASVTFGTSHHCDATVNSGWPWSHSAEAARLSASSEGSESQLVCSCCARRSSSAFSAFPTLVDEVRVRRAGDLFGLQRRERRPSDALRATPLNRLDFDGS